MPHFFHHRRGVVCAAVLILFTPGCYRRVSYESPGGRRIEIKNVGFDTSIGKLHAKTADGSITLENVSSQAGTAERAAEALEEAAGVLRQVGGGQ